MAKSRKKKPAARPSLKSARRKRPDRRRSRWRWVWRAFGVVVIFPLLFIALFALVNPPITHTIWAERQRLGSVERDWVAADQIAPVVLRSVVAAEDANYCLHWGFDMDAIRKALNEGARRGASTISQQTVKNVFLWQERSWSRKAMEAMITPVVEAVWSKRRILEVYLNVAEFGEGVFGIEAAARHYYDRSAADLTATQAARLAVILPNPKRRNPLSLSPNLRRRAAQVAQGAETIRQDGRSSCFES